jgi:hypothetical protein
VAALTGVSFGWVPGRSIAASAITHCAKSKIELPHGVPQSLAGGHWTEAALAITSAATSVASYRIDVPAGGVSTDSAMTDALAAEASGSTAAHLIVTEHVRPQ